jgi:hypothetical protein
MSYAEYESHVGYEDDEWDLPDDPQDDQRAWSRHLIDLAELSDF